MRILIYSACIVVVPLFFGCDEGPTVVERDGEPPITFVEKGDPAMASAIEKARATVDQFTAALEDPQPGQGDFSIKYPVVDGEMVEHMWLVPVRFEDGRFIGNINNEPYDVTTVKLGDEVTVAPDEISDWMYVEDNKLVGGYTIRVFRDQLNDAERKALDADLGFTVD